MMTWLFKRKKEAGYYARLDARGYCESLWRLDSPPQGQRWIGVRDLDQRQIGRPADQLNLRAAASGSAIQVFSARQPAPEWPHSQPPARAHAAH